MNHHERHTECYRLLIFLKTIINNVLKILICHNFFDSRQSCNPKIQ